MRVAVLGAGFQGACVALELARRGLDVDLFDRNDRCITQAGYRNEGKIHLGFVYANDPTFATARLMARGALAFGPSLHRWIECDLSRVGVSTPFDYVVHRDSIVSPDQIAAHFAKVGDCIHELRAATGGTYLAEDAPPPSYRFAPATAVTGFDPKVVAAVIQTGERAVNVRRLAEILRARVADEPRIVFIPGTRVTAIARRQGGFEVSFSRDEMPARETYRQVVNCLWDGRLMLDRTMGVLPVQPWLHRLRFGVTLVLKRPFDAIPSVTIVLGPYGDVVKFSDRHFHLSWYPAGIAGFSRDLSPPDWPRDLSGDAAESLIERTVAGLAAIVPALRPLRAEDIEQAVVAGGIIVAAGTTDIDDPASGLHKRSSVGPRSFDGYHSVDTGKFTLAPMFAVETADRVCGTA